MRVNLFVPAYNIASSLPRLLGEFADVEMILSSKGHEMCLLVINDNSTDGTDRILNRATEQYRWLQVRHNDKNLGNAGNIAVGYQWGVTFGADLIGCMDGDGEHSPYALIRHIGMIERNECDGVVGSIIFPDHDQNYHDRNMMKFWGGMQAAMAGIDGMFYIQSPGYNLHRLQSVEGALRLLEGYQAFFAENSSEPFPRWGMHGVMIYLISVGTGAHVKAAYLECFGHSPNRTPDKLMLQANAANVHGMMLPKFLPKK